MFQVKQWGVIDSPILIQRGDFMFLDTMDLGTKYRDSVLAKMEKNYQLFSFYNTIELLALSKFD